MAYRKKETPTVVVKPATISTPTITVSVSASGPWGEEEKEFIYPGTASTAAVTTSLAHELGTTFKPKTKKKIIEVVEVAKSQITDFQVGINLEDGIYLKIKREPKKIIKFFTSEDE